MILFKLIGTFFATEGVANLFYWYYTGGGIKDNRWWQLGRILRTILGIVLVATG